MYYIVSNDWRLIYTFLAVIHVDAKKIWLTKKIELYIWWLKSKNDEFLKSTFRISTVAVRSCFMWIKVINFWKIYINKIFFFTFFCAETIDINFIHSEYNVTSFDLENNQAKLFYVRRIYIAHVYIICVYYTFALSCV